MEIVHVRACSNPSIMFLGVPVKDFVEKVDDEAFQIVYDSLVRPAKESAKTGR